MASKNRLTVNLSDQELLALANLAEKTKVSKSWLGRKAISELLKCARSDERQLTLPLIRGKGEEAR